MKPHRSHPATAMRTVLATCLLAAIPVAVHAGSGPVVVMSGLDNPRGLAIGPEGALYVVEAGSGGEGPCTVLRDLARCYGPSGAVSRLWQGVQSRVVEGLPSYTDAGDVEVTGPHDIGFQGRDALITVGFGADPVLRSGFGAVGASFGSLVRATQNGSWRVIADISAHEGRHNPAGGPIDSNPYGVLAMPAGKILVTDAGANALLSATFNGRVNTVTPFPSRPMRDTDAVPTSVVRGPDGAYYVGELTGAPFNDGASLIWRSDLRSPPTIHAEGFKTIIDLDFGPDGSLYVLQHATGPMFFAGPGEIVRLPPEGKREVVLSGLSRPTSLVVAADGTLYVTNNGVSIGDGEVLRLDP